MDELMRLTAHQPRTLAIYADDLALALREAAGVAVPTPVCVLCARLLMRGSWLVARGSWLLARGSRLAAWRRVPFH